MRPASDKAQDVKHTTAKPRTTKASKYQAVQGPFDFTNVAPTGLEEAIWSGKKGFSVAGQGYFTFGKGATGAFVHTIRAWDIEQDIPNLQGHVSYTPEFITLAHELGHAMHHLAGATTGQTTLDATLRPAGSTAEQWSNTEEIFTIMGIDNPIRREAGLDFRATHATLPGGRKTQIKAQLIKAFGTRVNAAVRRAQGRGQAGPRGLDELHVRAGDAGRPPGHPVPGDPGGLRPVPHGPRAEARGRQGGRVQSDVIVSDDDSVTV